MRRLFLQRVREREDVKVTMRTRLLLAAALLFCGACDLGASERVAPTVDFTSVRLEVVWIEGQEELAEAVKQYNPSEAAWSAAYANGFSVLVRAGDELVCRLFVRRPQRVDDDRTLTLGHELLHCLAGRYHD